MDNTNQVNPNVPQDQKQNGQSDVEKYKMMAVIAYFLFFIPLITDAKDSPFAKFHSKQSLLLVLVALAGGVIGAAIPILGLIIAPIISMGAFVLWIIGLMNALNGKMVPVPLIGKYAEQYFTY